MTADLRKRRVLAAEANRLKVSATLSPDAISDSAVEHVRRCLAHRELVKVRIQTPDREEFRLAAELLAQRVPCEIVQRVGRVATLYRPCENADK